MLARIAEAERIEQAATLPPVLVGNFGPDAADRWAKFDMTTKRQIITAAADIRVKRCGATGYPPHPSERVEWRWLLGPDVAAADD